MIRYYNEYIEFNLKNRRTNSKWLKDVAVSENKTIGDINIIFTSDSYLLDVNIKFLGHDYFTDIITFDYCDGKKISGDLFISLDTIRANAEIYGTSFDNELDRVMVHGVLHLIGYDDHLEEEQKIMRMKENFYLEKKRQY